jgi:hypothetical protein
MSINPISLKKLTEGRNPYKVLLEETRALVNKWEPTGLLEGLGSDSETHGMAILLENQSRELIDESTKTGGTDAEAWAGVALPLVRRIFGEIAAKEFVSVQPMNLPSGLVFYLDFKYAQGTTQPGFTPGTSVFGGSNNSLTNNTLFGRTDVAENGLYGAGRFGYTINDLTASYVSGAVANTASASVVIVPATDAGWQAIDFNPALSASLIASKLYTVTVGLPTTADVEGVRAFAISGSGIVGYYPQNTGYFQSGGSGYAVFIVSGAASTPTGINGIKVTYHAQPTKESRGDFEDSSYLFNYQQLDIPEIDLQLRSEPIVAKTRKLKAVWTPEMAQDLNAFHSVDAEAELTSMLSEYISMEIDLEILDMLIQNALTEDFWSARVGYEWNGVSSFTAPATGVGQFYTRQTWYQTLGTKIQKVSNRIHQKTMRGGANFLVCSPDVATILESIPGFAVDTDGDKMSFAMGVSKVGSFANRFQVYKNPYMIENVILMGFRGTSFLETGAVYAPYVPLITTPLVYDPNNLTPRKGVMTRYAKKVVRPEFFGRIVVEGLATL